MMSGSEETGAEVVISVTLPVDQLDDERILERAVVSYREQLDSLGENWEILIVPQTEGAAELAYQGVTSLDERVRSCPAADGWGAAVRAGLLASRGRILGYTNWKRTSAVALSEMLSLAVRNQDVVLRANRRTRDTRVRRIGSLLYNLECRLLLQVPAWDVNGTPKIFPRSFAGLLDLTQAGDLLDAEFAAVCERAGYPVIEVPVDASLTADTRDAFSFRSALRMYWGVIELRGGVIP